MADKQLTTRRQAPQADAGVRAMKAWSARITGSTWSEAAEMAGFTDASNALRAVKVYFGTLPQPKRDDQRSLWRARHEHLWTLALRDAQAGRAGAVRAAVAVSRSAAVDQLGALFGTR